MGVEKDRIILGDCLDVMQEFPDSCIDCIITDPPYSVGTTSTGGKGDWHDNNLIRPFFKQLFKEYKRLLKYGAEFYINTDWRTYPFLYPLLYDAGLVIKNCIVWDYEWIKAGSHYRFSHEFIIYGFSGKNKRSFNAAKRDVWRIKPINYTGDKLHQAEKPVELIVEMINNSTKESDLVLDTFCGSGTTAIGCIKTGRHYIGIEINEKYFDIAESRIAQEREQGVLFAPHCISQILPALRINRKRSK